MFSVGSVICGFPGPVSIPVTVTLKGTEYPNCIIVTVMQNLFTNHKCAVPDVPRVNPTLVYSSGS